MTATVPVGKLPFDLAVDPDTHDVWITRTGDNAVAIMDANSHGVGTVQIGDDTTRVAFDPGAHTAYITHACCVVNTMDDELVAVVDTNSRTVVATVRIKGNPGGVAVDPNTHTAYVTAGDRNDIVAVSR